MLIAQISDLHIQKDPGLDGVLPAEHLRRALAAVQAFDPRPDLVVATGDLTNHGRPEEYQLLRQVLAGLGTPLRMIPGNHDDPIELVRAFPDDPWLNASTDDSVQYVDDAWPMRIIALDTTVRGHHQGALTTARLQWLSERLAEQPGRPTILLMHHPPFDTGIRKMDAIGLLEGRDEFLRVIAPYPNIERILCGHVHRTIACKVGPTIACTCPGTAHQVELDLSDPGRLAAYFEPPGYQIHWARPGATVTHHAVIGHFQGPYYE